MEQGNADEESPIGHLFLEVPWHSGVLLFGLTYFEKSWFLLT